MANVKNIIEHLPLNTPVMQIHNVTGCDVAFKEALEDSGWFKQEKARLDAAKEMEEYFDSPEGRLEMSCVDLLRGAVHILEIAESMPEMFTKIRLGEDNKPFVFKADVAAASCAILQALDRINGHKGEPYNYGDEQ